MTKKRVTPDMYALSTFIFLAILALLLLSNFIQDRQDNKVKRHRARKERVKK